MRELVPKEFNFALALKSICKLPKNTEGRVANKLGIKLNTLSNWKRGKSIPRADVGLAIINMAYNELGDEQFGECLKN